MIYVVDQGKDEKAQPPIAGVYQSAALNSCIGPAPKPVGGAPLPPTAPTQVPAPGPTFNVLQSGQFVNFTNNQGTLGGKLRLNEKTLANGGHQLTGDVECVNGGSKPINAIATPGAKGVDRGHARRRRVRGELQERPAGRRRAGAAHAGQPEGHVHDVADLHLPGRQVRTQRQRADLRRVVEGRAARQGHLLRHDRRSRR